MKIIYAVFFSLFFGLRLRLRQTLLRVYKNFLHLCFSSHIALESLKLAHRLVYSFRFFLHARVYAYLFYLYPSCFLYVFQGIGVLGLRMVGCHNDGTHLIRQEYLQKIKTKIFDAHKYLCIQARSDRTLYLHPLSTPSIVFHCKKYLSFLYQPSPKICEYTSVIEFSYRHLQCWSLPGDSNRAGNLLFH